MRVWIDHTGFQAAGASLSEENPSDGLMQFATLLAFSDRVELNRSESPAIRAGSVEVREELSRIGVSNGVLGFRQTADGDYKEACLRAAAYCQDKIGEAFAPVSDPLASQFPASMTSGDVSRQLNWITDVLFADGPAVIDEARAWASEAKSDGAVVLMMVTNDRLRSAVAAAVAAYGLNAVVLRQIENFLRFHLNQELGRTAGATYAPSVGRARVVRANAQAVALRVGELLNGFAERTQNRSLGIPSVHQYLLNQSGGRPQGVIETALQVRDRTADLRARLAIRLDATDVAARSTVEREIRELSEELEAHLGLRTAPSPWDAVDFSIVVALPPLTLAVSGRKLAEWWSYRKAEARNAVLTEISRGGTETAG